jgi:hypothetical protein
MAINQDTLYRMHDAYSRFEVGRWGANGWLTEYWLELLKRDPDLRTTSLCFDLIFGNDKIVRVSTKPCSVVSSFTGERYTYLPVVSEMPSLSSSYTVGNGASVGRMLGIGIPNTLVDVARLISEGRMLAGVCEVSLQVDGNDHQNRLVLLRGDMADGIALGALRQAVELSVGDPKGSIDVSLPPYIIDRDSFPDAADNAIGQRYAIVMSEYNFIPCWWIDVGLGAGRVLASHGRMTYSGSSTVNIDGTTYAGSSTIYPWEFGTAQDAQGNEYSYVHFTGSGTGTFEHTEQVYANLTGGVGGTSPVTQVRAICESYTALGLSGVSDLLFADAQAKVPGLNSRLLVNAGGAGNTTALQYVENEFLSSFPMISMLWHATGYGPIVTDRRSSTVVMHLTASQWPIFDRATYVEESAKDDCFNDFTLQYDYDPVEDSYAGVVTVGAGNSILCELSLDQLGHRPHDVMESRYIFDQASAEYVVDWMVDHMTLPSYYVEYSASPSLYVKLKPGDNVTITDSEFGWQAIAATVEKLTWQNAECRVGLRVWWRYYTVGTGASNASTPAGSGGQG